MRNSEESRGIIPRLRRLRAFVRANLVWQELATLLAIVAIAAVGLGLLDYIVRFPSGVRIAMWSVGLAGVAWFVFRRIAPAVRFHPTLTDIALRVEERRPEFKGMLASAVDFTRHPAGAGGEGPHTREMASGVLREISLKWSPLALRGVVDSGRSTRRTIALVAAGVLACSPLLFASGMWGIGVRRVLTPWTAAAWPKRADIADATLAEVHPRGESLALRAVLVRSPHDTENADVTVRYQSLNERGETVGPVRAQLLTWQREQMQITEGDETDKRGALFERLIDPSGAAVRYRFESDDDSTPWRSVRLVDPPVIAEARVVITPPEYVRSAASVPGGAAPGDVVSASLGTGVDERAVAPKALGGSRVELTIELNKPARIDGGLGAALQSGGSVRGIDAPADPEEPARTHTAAFTLSAPLRLPIDLVDEHGISSLEEPVFHFRAIDDAPPGVTITDPERDITVLPGARIDVTTEARDDVGLESFRLERQVFISAGDGGDGRSGVGGAVEARDDPVSLFSEQALATRETTRTVPFDLAPLALEPGNQVVLQAYASDAFRDADGAARGASSSKPRTLIVLSRTDFVEEVRRSLGEVRDLAIRTDNEQERLRERTQRDGAGDSARRGQARISQRIAAQEDALRGVRERLERNRLSDAVLDAVLREAGDAVAEAGNASAEASEVLDRAATRAGGGQEQGEQSGDTDAGDEDAGREPGDRADDTETPETPDGDQQSERADGAEGAQPGERGRQVGANGSDAQSGQQGQQDGQGGQEGAAQAEAGEQQEGELTPEERERVEEAQERVEEELARVVRALDSGQDTWVVRNELESMLDEQQELRERTNDAASRTAGRSLEQLSREEREELEEVVREQEELRSSLDDLLEEMARRERELEGEDPLSAQSLRNARRSAEQSGVGEEMDRSANEARQNRMVQSGRAQQRAAQAMQQMLEGMEESQQDRPAVLRRVLQSVIESITSLIAGQKQELAALDEARTTGDFAGLDEGMIDLHRNTLGVVDTVNSSGPEFAQLASIVSRASDAQAGAITALRDTPVDDVSAGVEEEESLDLLEQALEQAQSLDQDLERREREQQQRELREAFREMLETQNQLLERTQAYAGLDRIGRRDRIEVLGIGEDQRELLGRLDVVLKEHEEFTQAGVFEYTASRADTAMGEAASRLEDIDPLAATGYERQAARLLRGIYESLKDPEQDEPFDTPPAGSGGRGNGSGQQGEQPLIPPIAQLRLLRELQVGVKEHTRALEAGGEADPALIEDLAKQQRELHELGNELLEEIQQQGGGGGSGPDCIDPEEVERIEGESDGDGTQNDDGENDQDGGGSAAPSDG